MKISFQNQRIEITQQGTTRKVIIQNQNTTLVSASESDPNFPQQLSSIGVDIRKDLDISWLHIEQICNQIEPNYSDSIVNLNQPEYCNKAITHCLHVLNWFAVEIFALFFSDRIVTKLRTYEFAVSFQGLLKRVSVNSKVPVLDGRILFAQPVGGSIFGAIFEKLLAKCYGSYETIPNDLISLLQLCTGYVIQRFHPHQHTASEFAQFIHSSHRLKSLVFFRTRRSAQLQTLGIPQNTVFLIARLLQSGGKDVVEFLEWEGRKWEGKYSKKWAEGVAGEEKLYLTNSEKGGIQNYISLTDMLGISRELVILHNSQQYSINWVSTRDSKPKHTYSLCIKDAIEKGDGTHTMICINFQGTICTSWCYLICEFNGELVSCSFKKNKDSNFLAALLKNGHNYFLYVYAENKDSMPPAHNISVYSQHRWCEIKEVQKPIFLEETSFLQFFSQVPSVQTFFQSSGLTSSVSTKCLYRQLGLGAIIIKLETDFKKWVKVRVNKVLLEKHGVEIMNRDESTIWYSSPCHSILLLKFKDNTKYKEGDPFPPLHSISITVQDTPPARDLDGQSRR